MKNRKIVFFGNNITYNEYLNTIHWKKIRKEAKYKYGFKCEHCSYKKIQVHHNKYPIDFKDDNVDNLVICCPRCHGLHHSKRDIHNQKKMNDYITIKRKTIFDYENDIHK